MVGKRVLDEVYVHLTALSELNDRDLEDKVSHALRQIPADAMPQPNVAKFNLRTGHFSLLAYEDFEQEPFPTLLASWRFASGPYAAPAFRTYIDSTNPPILHRKERLVASDHPRYRDWSRLTSTAEALGLFDDTRCIGFRQNWERLISSKGFILDGDEFKPLGNDIGEALMPAVSASSTQIQRHLTALSRGGMSAPVQLLMRHGLLSVGDTFFDYGCGRGDDIHALQAAGFSANGWDPHFAPDGSIHQADVVNLGFVVNVIEDAAERVDALHRAFSLARRVMSIGVMLSGSEPAGKPFRDGYLTSKNTFQKYFSQGEIKDWIEQVLHRQAFMLGPGVAVVFADQEAEQRFGVRRYRRADLATRLLASRRSVAKPKLRTVNEPKQRPTQRQSRVERLALARQQQRDHLAPLWKTALELGRFPEPDELPCLREIEDRFGGLRRAVRIVERNENMELLEAAATARADDVRLYLAMQLFGKRAPYRQLEQRLQRDIKAFFRDHASAQRAALDLLHDAANTEHLRTACHAAARAGVGWLEDDRSLQLHVSLVDRLPTVLRAYVACGQLLWNASSETQLVKIHIESGKLSLLEFEDFDASPIPLLKRRIKINVRRLNYEVFEYGSREFPKAPLYRKSRYLNEDCGGYAEQLEFDEALESTGLLDESEYGPPLEKLQVALDTQRLTIEGWRLCASSSIPDLDQACGQHFTFRSFVACGETQARLGLANIPLRAETYNALHSLATKVLDPIIEYFGAIKLTFGFASPELSSHIKVRIAPRLDQHAACEHSRRGDVPICSRGGAACDFLVEDEHMRDVADWVIENVPFDRLYYYGPDRPLHVSWSMAPSREAFEMRTSARGHLMPRPYKPTKEI